MASNHHQDDHLSQEKSGLNRRGFLKRSGLAAGAATVFSFLGITPFPAAHAASSSGITNKVLDASQAEPYIQEVLHSSDYHRFQHLVQHTQDGIFTIQEHQVRAVQVSSKTQTLVAVRIPVVGGAGYSYYLAWLQPRTMTILQTQGALFKPAGGQIIDVYAERNGQVVLQKVFGPDGKPVDGSSVITPDVNWLCVAFCLGVAPFIVAAALSACAAWCAFIGFGCEECLAIAIGTSVTLVQRCVDHC